MYTLCLSNFKSTYGLNRKLLKFHQNILTKVVILKLLKVTQSLTMLEGISIEVLIQ
jgi:hypothetical protein